MARTIRRPMRVGGRIPVVALALLLALGLLAGSLVAAGVGRAAAC